MVFLLAVAGICALAVAGLAGTVGDVLNDGLRALFGATRFLVPLALVVIALSRTSPGLKIGAPGVLGVILFVASINGLLELGEVNRGGYLGVLLSRPLIAGLGLLASGVVLSALALVSMLLMLDTSLERLAASHRILLWPFALFKLFRRGSSSPITADTGRSELTAPDSSRWDVKTVEVSVKPLHDTTGTASAGDAKFDVGSRRKYRKIELPLDLLSSRTTKPQAGDIDVAKERIRKTFEHFGVMVEMGDVSVGPTVTQYTFRPAEGVKLTRITGLANDLALALAAHPIRIEAPIPGKSLVGVEVPNQAVAVVPLREILDSREFRERKSNLTLSLGKDVSGTPNIADLSRMPHLLVAGATGSGKTVCLNSLIVSLLFQNGPDECKFIMIDPKRVELLAYNGIPHLVTPVITDIAKTVNAFKWTIGEMERRFDTLSKSGHRDIGAYNRAALSAAYGHAERAAMPERMPYLVLVVDELADLMISSASEVEPAIIRLAQMSRATGIHLILATQRPSVDVITGLIKANITSRIAFAVASSTDSRTILDTTGAEKLLGRGDMLYTSAELSKPKRLQGAMTGDEDIKNVVDRIKSQAEGPPEYVIGVTERLSAAPTSGAPFAHESEEGDDELLMEAKDTVLRAGKASASLLQRRLKVGYARAARLLDLLEEQGVIGPGDGAKPRAILVSRPTEYENLPVEEENEEGKETEELT